MVELSRKSFKEGANCGLDPSLGILFNKSLLAHHVSEPISESWVKILGPTLPTSQALNRIL
jgi:hypothetical protein